MATIERYQTKGGVTLYAVRYRKPDHKQTWKRGFTTKRDAEAFAATVEVEKLRGTYIAPKLGRTTIGALGPQWLERQRGLLKSSTFLGYETCWRVHIEPRWGRTRIADIQFTDVQAWVSELSTRRSASLVCDTHMVLAQILDDAVTDRLLSENPARNAKLKLPKRPPRRNIYLSASQLAMLADEAGRYRSLVLLLGVGGLRWGEAVALRVSDIDFQERRVALHTSIVRTDSGFVAGTLKSNKNRVVVLPSFVADALAGTCDGKARDDLLWPSATGGYLGWPSPHGSWLSGAVKRCQVADPKFPRVTAHDLRHTAASLAIHAGANPKVVQRMLGHESAAMTLDVYADLFDSDLATVADSVAKMWPGEDKESD